MEKQITRFQKGSGCYTCISCGKLTRATGYDNSHAELQLCASCYDDGGKMNYHSDQGHSGDYKMCQICKADLG